MAPADDMTPALVPVNETALTHCNDPIFLGLWQKEACFAADISHHEDPPFIEFGTYRDLREVGPLMGGEEAAILAYARAMTTWQSRHRFCGRCGSPTESREAGHVQACTNRDCGFQCFGTDPAVIMLIHDGGDRCILGGKRFGGAASIPSWPVSSNRAKVSKTRSRAKSMKRLACA